MGIEYGQVNNYAKYGQPTLDLVFTGPKESVTDRAGNVSLEFTRSSTATYVGSDGLIKSAAVNEARFDHDKDGNGLGLLIEEARTNLNIYSVFSSSQSGWTKNHTFTEAETAPDGTSTASSGVKSAGDIFLRRAVNTSGAGDYVFTCYLKADANTELLLRFIGNTFQNNKVNVTTEWVRYEVVFNVTTETSVQIQVGGNGTPTVGTKFFFWGMQVEKASFPTSYIPTSGSTVTRAVDTVSLTGTNFSSWYNGSQGSIFIDMKRPVGPSNSGAFLEFFNNAGLFLQDASGNFRSRIGAENNFITLGNPATTTDYKIASSYQSANDYKVSSNGSSVTSGSTSVDFTTATELHIGRGNNAFTSHWRNGPRTLHLKRFTFWPTRLSDSDLQSLTE